jgi:hypothetical protein
MLKHTAEAAAAAEAPMPNCCHCSVCLQPSLGHKAWLTSSNLRHQVLALLLIASLASQGFDANLRCAVAAKLWRPSLRGLGRPSLVGYRTAQPWSRRPSPPLVELRRRASLTKPNQAKPYCTLVLPSPIRPSASSEHSRCLVAAYAALPPHLPPLHSQPLPQHLPSTLTFTLSLACPLATCRGACLPPPPPHTHT